MALIHPPEPVLEVEHRRKQRLGRPPAAEREGLGGTAWLARRAQIKGQGYDFAT